MILLAGCAARTPLERAVALRGPAIGVAARRSAVNVLVGYPGTWQSQMTFATPERYAWSYETTAEPYHYLYDGTAVRSFVGSAMVSEDASPTAPLRSHARLTAVMLLAWPREGAAVTSDPGSTDGTERLRVTYADGAEYRVVIDAAGRVAAVEGQLDFPGVGSGRVVVSLSDYRPVGPRTLPFHLAYVLGDRPFADETVAAWCVESAAPAADAFRAPAGVPACR